MSKIKFNAILNIVSSIDFLLVFISVLALQFLPKGFQGGRNVNYLSAEFLGGSRHFWENLHTYSGWVILALIFIHLLLHANWLKCLPGIFKKINT